MSTGENEKAVALNPLVQRFAVGDRVTIKNDGDGYAGKVATIGRVYRSGRCRVDLPGGGFRNLSPSCLEAVE